MIAKKERNTDKLAVAEVIYEEKGCHCFGDCYRRCNYFGSGMRETAAG